VTGINGESSAIIIPESAVATNPLGAVEIITEEGEVFIASSGLIVSTPEILEIEQGTPVCVPVSVTNFRDLLSMQFSINWDAAILQFDSINAIELPGLNANNNFNSNDANNGVITLSWTAIDSDNGQSIPDETAIFELCFTAVGDLGVCTNLSFSGTPSPVEVINSDGTDVGLQDLSQQICISDFGIINDLVTAPTCMEGDGAIQVQVVGGSGNYNYFWTGASTDNGASVSDIELNNLSEGEFCLTVIDANDAGKSRFRCFTLAIEDDRTPEALAGDDVDLGCVDPDEIETTLIGDFLDAQSGGGTFEFKWTGINGGVVKPFEDDQLETVILTAGTYVLKVTNTSNRCFDTDTVEVTLSEPPLVEIVPPADIICVRSTVLLDASKTVVDENHTFEWSTTGGNFLNDPAGNLTPIVDQPGTYIFTLMNNQNDCSSSATFEVGIDTIKPTASAGPDLQMTCTDNFLTLDGTGSTSGENIEFFWSTPNGSSIANFNLPEPDITRVGTYVLTVSNLNSGCQDMDTMFVSADEELPVAMVNEKAIIGCNMNEVELDASASSIGDRFQFEWQDQTGTTISNEVNPTFSEVGQYLLIVINIENDDCISDSAFVNVRINDSIPEAFISNSLTFGCESDCLELMATAQEGEQFVYQWITDEGLICEGENETSALIGAQGLYKFIITNTENNCSDTSSTFVSGSPDAIIADAGPARQLDCNTSSVILNGGGSTLGDNISYEWITEDGMVVSNEITAEVDQPGQYQLEVTDTEKGCSGVSNITVSFNADLPEVNAGEDVEIPGCEFPEGLRLNGSSSASGDNITYQWEAINGGMIIGSPNSINPEIGATGTYQLTIFNTENGCSASDIVVISGETNIPVSNAGEDQSLNCLSSTLILDGSNSEASADAVIEWTTTDGNIVGGVNTLMPEIDAPGTYTLVISNGQGCSKSDEVVVTSDIVLPEVNAGTDVELFCEVNTQLNASGSIGEDLTVEWSTSDGLILSGAEGFSPQVSGAGIYRITITNTQTGCTANDEVMVIADDELPMADAGGDQQICINETTLQATPVTSNGVSGVWRTLGGTSAILSDADPQSGVADLAIGINRFVWVLSSENCPDYGADTVSIEVAFMPEANDDALELPVGSTQGTIDLLRNDNIASNNFTINLLSQPQNGRHPADRQNHPIWKKSPVDLQILPYHFLQYLRLF
jgi:hypothetical protein